MLTRLVGILSDTDLIDLIANASGSIQATRNSTTLAIIRKALSQKPPTIQQPDARRLALCVPREAIREELGYLSKLPELTTAAEAFATTLEFRQSIFPTTSR